MNLRKYQKKLFIEKILKKLQNIDKNNKKIELKKEIFKEYSKLYLKIYDSLSEINKEEILNISAFYCLDSYKCSFLSKDELIAHKFNISMRFEIENLLK